MLTNLLLLGSMILFGVFVYDVLKNGADGVVRPGQGGEPLLGYLSDEEFQARYGDRPPF